MNAHWPPMLVRLRFQDKGEKRFQLWIPLILLYVLLSPLLIFVIAFLMIASFAASLFLSGVRPLQLCENLYEMLCSLRGLRVEVKSKDENIFIQVF